MTDAGLRVGQFYFSVVAAGEESVRSRGFESNRASVLTMNLQITSLGYKHACKFFNFNCNF